MVVCCDPAEQKPRYVYTTTVPPVHIGNKYFANLYDFGAHNYTHKCAQQVVHTSAHNIRSESFLDTYTKFDNC